ncbi:MAG: 1-deoxy-D-xylulose-5-phosphate reductoisomerase [Gemmataceae bacterium]
MSATQANGQAGPHRNVVILGSTGSIGTNCLDVISHLPNQFSVLGMSAHKNVDLLLEQAHMYKPRWIALTDSEACDKISHQDLPEGCTLLQGQDGILQMVTDPDADVVVTAIVGAAGLEGTWAALEAGKTIALANKETLVMAGALVMDLARERNVPVLPVDSEHSAIFQAMLSGKRQELERIVLTASGGPFRGRTRSELESVTVEEALKHPTWQMGPKITIDSATMMNKSLEVIEARWLFDLKADEIDVIVHPDSIIHSFVEFRDGSVIAQLSPPDMRLPIQYALTYPHRVNGPTKRLDWKTMSTLRFEQPDYDTFPALLLGLEVARRGGTCGAVLNAANEAAVQEFLDGRLPFLDIPRVCREVLDHHDFIARPTITELYSLDRWARQEVARWITKNQFSQVR